VTRAREITQIPIDQIDILNPRERKQKTFREIVASIKALGLKKPTTVTPRKNGRYGLVCGQGRLEAFQSLGEVTIPAFVINANDEEAYIMSLVENIARRNPTPSEQLETIRSLQKHGYSVSQICKKTALEESYVRGILSLLNNGEHRLINAVELGKMPLATAIAISRAEGGEEQQVLQDAYENGALRGRKLLTVRKLIEKRRVYGRGMRKTVKTGAKPRLSSAALVRAYNQEVERQKVLIRKADIVQQRLTFVGAAMGRMLADDNFINLLRAEGLETLPKPLEEKIRETGAPI
jgi:ParB family transcriptional regulator, chromosome partitioning protein